MENENNLRFAGTVDHLAIKCDDLEKDVDEYKRLGFTVETIYEDWAMMRDAHGFGIALLPPNSKQKKSDILKFRLTTVFHSLYLIDKIYLRGILYGKQK